VNLANGTASLRAENVCVFDAFTVPNSLDLARPLGNLVKGVINRLHIEWSGVERTISGFSDSTDQFRGDFIENSARIEVVVTTPASTGHGFKLFLTRRPANLRRSGMNATEFFSEPSQEAHRQRSREPPFHS